MKLEEMWKKGDDSAGGGMRREPDPLKDGVYRVEVVSFRFFRSNDGPYYYSWGFEVVDGLSKGSYTEKFSGTSAISMEILNKDCRRVSGRWFDLKELYDQERDCLGPAVSELIGAVLEVQKKDDPGGRINQKTGKPYFDIRFLSLIKGVQNGAGAAAAPVGEFLEDPEGELEEDEDEDEEEEDIFDDDEKIPF